MGAKRISLSAGFEDLLGTLRGSTGELPSEGEMAAVSGETRGVAYDYGFGLKASGSRISAKIQQLERRLQDAEEKIRTSISEQRATEAEATEALRKLLADLEGVRTEVTGEGPAPAQSVDKPSNSERPGLGKPGSH
ncbi:MULTISPECIES: hypothetical protein [unclassified Leucobacter]|uniref:hypothetical protein n=1 Tax=unclassified Leucobacter TaxID=2621730 RepID=UPI000A3E6C0B|nr:hypothetical protein [Leucobacter sp. Ag1]